MSLSWWINPHLRRRIGCEHHSSIVEVNGLYHELLTANTAGAVTGFSKETRGIQSYLKGRACTHVETAAWRFATAIPVERYKYKWRLKRNPKWSCKYRAWIVQLLTTGI